MRYFIDTEFDWRVDHYLGQAMLRPIGVGIVAEDGREFYGTYCRGLVGATPFVRDHVLPVAGTRFAGATHVDREFGDKYPPGPVGDEIRAFVGDDVPEFWGDRTAFDYAVLSMLMGTFADWPTGWPMVVFDLAAMGVEVGPSTLPHHALADARAVRDAYEADLGDGGVWLGQTAVVPT